MVDALKCLDDIVQVDERFNQIKCVEDLYDLLYKSTGSRDVWERTYMRYWAKTGDWKRFDHFYEMNSQFCFAVILQLLCVTAEKYL